MSNNLFLHSALFISLITVQVTSAQNADDLKEIRIPKKQTTTLTFDGIVDDLVWISSAKIETFENNMEKGSPKEGTSVYLFYDEDALYIAFQFTDRDIQCTYTQHDTDLWDEEVMEAFIYPHADIPNPVKYYELQWNPLGTVFDGIITNKMNTSGKSIKRDLDRDWKAVGMKHAVSVKGTLSQSNDQDTGWSGEIKIPFQSLNQKTPKPGDVWRVNFYRYSRNTNEPITYIAWNPTNSTFHEPNRFGRLIFQ